MTVGVTADEGFEEAVLVLFGDAGAVVGDGDGPAAVGALVGDDADGAVVGVFDGIADEVLQDEAGHFAIADEVGVGTAFDDEVDAFALGVGADADEGGIEEFSQIERFFFGRDHGVAEALGGEEAVHAIHGVEDGAADAFEVFHVFAVAGLGAEALAVNFEHEEGMVEMVSEIVTEKGEVLGFGFGGGAQEFALQLGEVVDAFLKRGIDSQIERHQFCRGEGALDGAGDLLDDNASQQAVFGEEFPKAVLVDKTFVAVGAGGFLERKSVHGAGRAEGIAEAVEEEGEMVAELGEGHGFGMGKCLTDGVFPAAQDHFLAVGDGRGHFGAGLVRQ